MKDYSNVKILLFGTGAVGSLYGGKLAQAGGSVSAVCRSDYNVVKEKGIFIKSIYGDFHFRPRTVVRKASEYMDCPDFIIITTKVLPGIDLHSLIKDAVKPSTSIVLLQNGIDVEKDIAATFPGNEVISALAFVCVSRKEYGDVEHQDYGRLVLGTYPSGVSEKASILAEMFRESGIPVETADDVIAARWKKLLWNAPFNPLSVIGGCVNTKEILSNRLTEELAEKIMREVYELSIADGHPVQEELINQNLEDTYKMVPYKTSMLLDYESGRPMEVEAILGNAVRIAQRLNVNVPNLKAIYAILDLLDKTNIERRTV